MSDDSTRIWHKNKNKIEYCCDTAATDEMYFVQKKKIYYETNQYDFM